MIHTIIAVQCVSFHTHLAFLPRPPKRTLSKSISISSRLAFTPKFACLFVISALCEFVLPAWTTVKSPSTSISPPFYATITLLFCVGAKIPCLIDEIATFF